MELDSPQFRKYVRHHGFADGIPAEVCRVEFSVNVEVSLTDWMARLSPHLGYVNDEPFISMDRAWRFIRPPELGIIIENLFPIPSGIELF